MSQNGFEAISAHSKKRPEGYVIALAIFLGAIAMLYFSWPAWRAQWHLEIDGNEAWNAFLVERLRSGLSLYPSREDLITNNYPPLSFLLLRFLQTLGFEPILAGRILSLIATVMIAAASGWIVRLLGGGSVAVFIAAAWYLATMSRFFDIYVGMNDPHLVALAIMTWGMGWIIWAQQLGKSVMPGFGILVVAGFYKHSLFAIPSTSLIWLFTCDRRQTVRAAMASLILVLLGLAICILFYGENFVAQLTAPRTLRAGQFIAHLGRIQFALPAIIIFLWWTLGSWRSPRSHFAIIFVIVAIASYVFQQFADGVDDNSQFEMIVALAIGLGLAFQYGSPTLPIQRFRIVFLSIILFRLLLSNRVEPYLLLSSKEFRDIGLTSTEVAKAEVERVAKIQGDVSCSIMTICYDAKKAFVYYGFAVQQKVAVRALTKDQLVAAVANRKIVFADIDPRADMRSFRSAASTIFVRRIIIY